MLLSQMIQLDSGKPLALEETEMLFDASFDISATVYQMRASVDFGGELTAAAGTSTPRTNIRA